MESDYLTRVGAKSQSFFDGAVAMMTGATIPSAGDGSTDPVPGRYALVAQARADSGPAPDVTVIIPTFNRPELLVHAVASVCRQIDVDLEIVIVNDGGTDLPTATLDQLLSHRRPLVVARHHRNLGLGAARNTGAWLARGTWLTMLDDDDTLVDGAIDDLMRVARTDGVSFAFGDHLRQWYRGPSPTHVEYRRIGPAASAELCTENLIICGSFIIARRTFIGIRGYREDLPVHEDYNLHLRVLSSTQPAYLAQPICVYHCRDTLPRLNHRRLFWFATSAFNHAIFRWLFHRPDDRAVKRVQRTNQYEHLARSLREGCPPDVARALVDRWWHTLRAHGLAEEIGLDDEVISNVCPSLRG